MSTQSPAAAPGATAQPLDAVAVTVVVGLCLVWGFNQVAVKLALPDIPPLTQALIRSVFGGLVVLVIARLRGVNFSTRDGTLAAGLLAGVLFGMEFVFIYRGLLWTTASRATLFIYLAPFFVVLGARWFLPGDRFNALQWAGLALSFAGIVLAFGLPTPADPRQMIGDLMMVVAAALWASTTLVVKASSLNRAPFEKTLIYQLVVSAPIFALGAVIFDERVTWVPSAVAVSSIVYQSIWVVGITFLLWFALIQRYSASRLSAFTFLTPLFGVAFGYLVLGEPLTLPFVIAVVCVIAGLILVNRPARRA